MKTINLFLIVLFTIICNYSFAQITKDDKSLLTGKVVDKSGKPISGATIRIKGISDFSATTDKKGNFVMKPMADSLLIIATSIGMQTLEIKIKDAKNLRLVMNPEIIMVDTLAYDVDEISISDDIVEMPVYEEAETYSYSDVSKSEYKKDKGESSSRSYKYESKTVVPTSGIMSDYSDGDAYSYTESLEGYTEDAREKETETKNVDAKSGMLTAGEIHDFSKWELWNDITENQLSQFKTLWQIYPLNRYCVQLTSKDGKPLIDIKLTLKNKNNETVWNAITDNTGKAELWAGMFDTTVNKKDLHIDFEVNKKSFTISEPKKFHDGINILSVESQCDIPNVVDIAFVVDATGSMSDEIDYLKAELLDIMQNAGKQHEGLKFNLGSVFYRDLGDAYLTKKSDLSSNLDSTINFIKSQYAGGGGDFPEAVDAGLEVAVNELKWSDKSIAKMLFLVLDAPPHDDQKVKENLEKITIEAAKKGIRIIPVTCSGIDKSTEYLMRSMALATNGTYVFLTDDSGIGDSHIAPTTDEYKVEYLNGLILRLIDQYTLTPTCDNKISYKPETVQDTTLLVINQITPFVDVNITNIDTNKTNTDLTNLLNNNNNNQNVDTTKVDNINNVVDVNNDNSKGIKYYPNPTNDIVNIEFIGDIKEIYIADNSGKLLERYKIENEEKIQINLESYPSGMYFIQYQNNDKWKSGKIILIRR